MDEYSENQADITTIEELREAIERIPGDNGWFHGSDSFHEIGAHLLERGLTPQQALDVLWWAYGAVANEFGA